MRKTKINIGNRDYILSLTRKSVEWLESQGFNVADVEKKPITSYMLMFRAGFIQDYPEVDGEKLYDQYEAEGGDASEVVSFLIEEYANFIKSLADTKSKKKKMEIL